MDFRIISHIARRVLAFRCEANYAELRIAKNGAAWIWAQDDDGHWAWGRY